MSKLILILALIVCIGHIGCSQFPSVGFIEVCGINQSKVYKRCAEFDFNYGKLLSVGDSVSKPLEIDRNICFSPKGFEDLIDYLDRVFLWKQKNFKSEEVDEIPLKIIKEKSPLSLLE